jgi:uncharacterized protein
MPTQSPTHPANSADLDQQPTKTEPKLRGFAALKLRDPEALRAICQRGGKSAHASGVAHEFTSEEAKICGRLGGRASHQKNRERQALLEVQLSTTKSDLPEE